MSFCISRDASDCPPEFLDRDGAEELRCERHGDVDDLYYRDVCVWERLWRSPEDVIHRNSGKLTDSDRAIMVGINSQHGAAFKVSCASKDDFDDFVKHFQVQEEEDFYRYWKMVLLRAHHTTAYIDVIHNLKRYTTIDDRLKDVVSELCKDEDLQQYFRTLPIVTPDTPVEERPEKPAMIAEQRDPGQHVFSVVKTKSSISLEQKEPMWSFRLSTVNYTTKKNVLWKDRALSIDVPQLKFPTCPAFHISQSEKSELTVAHFVDDGLLRLAKYALPDPRKPLCEVFYRLDEDFIYVVSSLSCSSDETGNFSAASFGYGVLIVDWSRPHKAGLHMIEREDGLPAISTVNFPYKSINLKKGQASLLIGTFHGQVFHINAQNGKIFCCHLSEYPIPIRSVVLSGQKLVAMSVQDIHVFKSPMLKGQPARFTVKRPTGIFVYGTTLLFSDKYGDLNGIPLDDQSVIMRNSYYGENEKREKDDQFKPCINTFYQGCHIYADGSLRSICYQNGRIRYLMPVVQKKEQK